MDGRITRPAMVVVGLVAVAAAAGAALVVQHSAGAATTSTRQVQWDLAGLGYLPWSGIDGVNGQQTKAAVRSFQSDRCLAVDGVAGPQTDGALSSVVSAVQGRAGATRDGAYGPKTKSAVTSWQRAHGLGADGIAGPNTMRAMGITRMESCGGTGSRLAQRAVSIAKAQEGKPYAWGGSGPGSYDCSGLVWYAYYHAGLHWTRTTAEGERHGYALTEAVGHFSRSGLRVGDLVYWDTEHAGYATHVGIYAGGDSMIEAPHTGDVVKSISISWYVATYPFLGANRPH
jgi:cell wall-associated NlpC family hydrolase